MPIVHLKSTLKFCCNNEEEPGQWIDAQPGYKKQYSSTRLWSAWFWLWFTLWFWEKCRCIQEKILSLWGCMSPKHQKYKQIHVKSPTHRNPSSFELSPYLKSIFILSILLLAFQCQKTLLKAVNVAKFICGVEQCPSLKRERYNSNFHFCTEYIAPVFTHTHHHLSFGV